MHQTNISAEQIKTQLPIFNGASSLSVLDALDTWTKKLANAGIHKQMWGGIILSKLENPALARIPPDVKRDQKFEDICSSLKMIFQSSLVATKNIMMAHEFASTIPDPYTSSTAALKVLRTHYEILEHAERFISLTSEENAAQTLMTGSNVEQLLNLLPQRVRMSDANLGIVEVNEEKRQRQYEAIKKWINDSQQFLLLQGTRLEDKVETHVAMATSVERRIDVSQRNNRSNGQNNRGNDSRRQNGWNNRQQQQGSAPQSQYYNPDSSQLVTSCTLCSLIKESDVSQEYVNRNFADIHYSVTDRNPYPNQCLPFMMLCTDDRNKVIQK